MSKEATDPVIVIMVLGGLFIAGVAPLATAIVLGAL